MHNEIPNKREKVFSVMHREHKITITFQQKLAHSAGTMDVRVYTPDGEILGISREAVTIPLQLPIDQSAEENISATIAEAIRMWKANLDLHLDSSEEECDKNFEKIAFILESVVNAGADSASGIIIPKMEVN